MVQQSSATLVYEIHEDRIQNLESCVNDTNAQLAEHSTKLDHISSTMDSVKQDMKSQMDKGFQDIKEEVKKTSSQIDRLHVTVLDHDKRIQNVERIGAENDSRWQFVLKIVAFLAAGVGGAVIKHLVDVWMK